MLLTGVAATGEIHLRRQCAPEGIVEGVVLKGEFHVTDLKESEEDILRIEPAVTASKAFWQGDGIQVLLKFKMSITQGKRWVENNPISLKN